jgi:hypothetical protein
LQITMPQTSRRKRVIEMLTEKLACHDDAAG